MHELSDLVPEPGARAAAIELLHARTAIYTAEPVVDDLLDRLDWPTGLRRIVDPSCGDGMFVARALERLLRLHAPDDSTLMRLVQGWEVHPGACEDARARVAQILMSAGRSVGRARRIARVMIVNRDFLSEGPSVGTADLVVANPPYIRKVRVPALLRREYEKYVPDYASHDLLHSFLERCARLLKPGGKIGMVTADRWLFNSGARRLREELGRRVSIRHLARLDAATAFHRPKRRLAGAPPRVHPVAVVLGCVLDGSGRSMTGDAVFPGVDMGRYAGVRTLGEIAQVRIAPWLGTPGIFVIDVATAARLPSSCLVPAVDTDDIVDGVLRHPVRFAIRTAPGQEPPAAILAHLEANRHRMAARGRGECVWLPPERFHLRDLSEESLLVPRIALSPKAVRVPAGVLAINHNLSVVCAEPAVLTRVERLLASRAAARWAREIAPRLEGGYFSLTTTLLRRMPMFDEMPETQGTSVEVTS